jgi:hypothetical protein
MEETKESEQLVWVSCFRNPLVGMHANCDKRVETVGWDSDERSYYVLDDNRLYRRTDPVVPTSQPSPKLQSNARSKGKAKVKAPPKQTRAGTRSSKRRKTNEVEDVITEEDEIEEPIEAVAPNMDEEATDYKWECVAVTLKDYQEFLDGIKKSKDPNERYLHRHITEEVIPIIENIEEARQRKIARRQKELQALEKMAHAKRSSRLAGKHEKEQQEAEARATEEKHQAELAAARKEEERLKKMGDARESRMMTREQRLKEREHKRVLHEEELRRLEEDSEKLESGDARLSERHLKAEMARKQRELEELQEEEDWVFDCAKCGVYGENVDDGSHSIACDRCKVWQHSECLGISQAEAEKDDFEFICDDCKAKEADQMRREEDAKKPKIPALKFKHSAVSSPPVNNAYVEVERPATQLHEIDSSPSKKRKSPDVETAPGMPPSKKWKPPVAAPLGSNHQNGSLHGSNGNMNGSLMHKTIMNGPTLVPQGQQARILDGSDQSPPPGLQSPSRPTSKSMNGPPAGIFSSSMQSLVNGNNPTHSTLPAPSPNVGGQRSSPPIATTPYQSFNNDQRTPATSMRSSFATPKNGSAPKSPAQSPAYPSTPSTKLPPSSSAAAPSLQPGFSPQKVMPSSPVQAGTQSPKLHDRSSPTMAPPPSDLQAAGASPLKHEPPRPLSSHGQAELNVLDTAIQLPRQQHPSHV